jgi:hypothetical protein
MSYSQKTSAMNTSMDGDNHSDVLCPCKHCNVIGCDVRILQCGCALHAVRLCVCVCVF